MNVTGLIAISASDGVKASVVSNNFSQFIVAMNSNALNSDNYGIGSIFSQNIGASAIQASHLSTNILGANHFSANAVNHPALDFASSNNGIRALRIGAASNSMPANGVEIALLTQSATVASNVNTLLLTHAFTNALYGNPAFTAAPTLAAEPVFQHSPSTVPGPIDARISTIDANSAVVLYRYSVSAGADFSVTAHAAFYGPK